MQSTTYHLYNKCNIINQQRFDWYNTGQCNETFKKIDLCNFQILIHNITIVCLGLLIVSQQTLCSGFCSDISLIWNQYVTYWKHKCTKIWAFLLRLLPPVTWRKGLDGCTQANVGFHEMTLASNNVYKLLWLAFSQLNLSFWLLR